MPILDGIQATRHLRARGYSRPILALTAHAMKEEYQRSLDSGCDDHITKPVSKRVLVESVLKHLRRDLEISP